MISIFFDGACGPINPGGIGSIGAIIKKDGKTIKRISEIFGEGRFMSSNVAEYYALLSALIWLSDRGKEKEPVEVYGDSSMVIGQASGRMRIRKGLYRETAIKCLEKIQEFSDIKFFWIPREENYEADRLSKSCL